MNRCRVITQILSKIDHFSCQRILYNFFSSTKRMRKPDLSREKWLILPTVSWIVSRRITPAIFQRLSLMKMFICEKFGLHPRQNHTNNSLEKKIDSLSSLRRAKGILKKSFFSWNRIITDEYDRTWSAHYNYKSNGHYQL